MERGDSRVDRLAISRFVCSSESGWRSGTPNSKLHSTPYRYKRTFNFLSLQFRQLNRDLRLLDGGFFTVISIAPLLSMRKANPDSSEPGPIELIVVIVGARMSFRTPHIISGMSDLGLVSGFVIRRVPFSLTSTRVERLLIGQCRFSYVKHVLPHFKDHASIGMCCQTGV